MALSNLYVVFDTIGKESGPLFHAKNDEVARRHFRVLIDNNEPSWQSDFDLRYVGEYCHETCIIFPAGEMRIISPTLNLPEEVNAKTI